jgi:hypothetical protein
MSKTSPYLPHPDDPVVARDLVLIKDAAEHFACSADTLKSNAKSRRFPAYQAGHGMPVFVALQDIAKFLKSRPDIESVFRKNGSKKSASPTCPIHMNAGTGEASSSSMQKPEAVTEILHVASLASATPEQFALVADCLEEIAGRLRQTIAAAESTGKDHRPAG